MTKNIINSILATAITIFSLSPFIPLHRILASILRYFYQVPPPEALMTTPQLIEHNGFSAEEHRVTTEDGYILTLFRIVPKNQENSTTTKGPPMPIVIQHGYLSSSDDFLLQAKDVSMPYILTDQGYDVWLSNSRGNGYSTKHITLTRRDLKFWDYGIDELGQYDTPAIINYVLSVTNHSRLNWIGHSLGTTSFFVALAAHPELNEKVNKMVALSPAFYVAHSTSPLLLWPAKIPERILQKYFKFVTGGHVVPRRLSHFLKNYMPYLANADFLRKPFLNIIFAVSGRNTSQLTPTSPSMIAGHFFSDTSGKLLIHIRQCSVHGKSRLFDYGPKINEAKYGTTTPPSYDLSRVRVPVQAWYGVNDLIINHEDAKVTISELGNVHEAIEVSDPKWTHMDFVYGTGAKHLIYDKMVKFLED